MAQSDAAVPSIILIVSWQWLPFATLILLTAIQSLDSEQLEAAEMDGAPVLARFFHIMLPHLGRAITIVILIQTIFLSVDLRRDLRDHQAAPFGTRTLTYLILPARRWTARMSGWDRRRGLRHHPGQYRCDLPDAHRRQEPGR
jgi:hypothetical protein